MPETKYDQFKKFILFEEVCVFIVSLYSILNEESEIKESNNFLMTYQNFKKCLRVLRKKASQSCGIVCYKDNACQGHKILQMMNDYEEFIEDCVENKSLFYKYVLFEKTFDDSAPMLGYIIKPKCEVDLGWKSWSQRMSYLN